MKKVIIFTERQLEMINEIKEEAGFRTLAEVMRNGLEMYHRSYFPAYKKGGNYSPGDTTESIQKKAELKAITKKAELEAETKLRLKPKTDMCINVLGGEVITNPDGSLICKWQNHGIFSSDEQQIPINQVGDYLIDNLFQPSKEAVFKARPDLRKKLK